MIQTLSFIVFVFLSLLFYAVLGLVGGTIAWIVLLLIAFALRTLVRWWIGDPMQAYDLERRH